MFFLPCEQDVSKIYPLALSLATGTPEKILLYILWTKFSSLNFNDFFGSSWNDTEVVFTGFCWHLIILKLCGANKIGLTLFNCLQHGINLDALYAVASILNICNLKWGEMYLNSHGCNSKFIYVKAKDS